MTRISPNRVRWLSAAGGAAAVLLDGRCRPAGLRRPLRGGKRRAGSPFASNSPAVVANAPAEITVTDKVLRPAKSCRRWAPTTGAAAAPCEWAANNFVHNSGNEPVYWRTCTGS